MDLASLFNQMLGERLASEASTRSGVLLQDDIAVRTNNILVNNLVIQPFSRFGPSGAWRVGGFAHIVTFHFNIVCRDTLLWPHPLSFRLLVQEVSNWYVHPIWRFEWWSNPGGDTFITNIELNLGIESGHQRSVVVNGNIWNRWQ